MAQVKVNSQGAWVGGTRELLPSAIEQLSDIAFLPPRRYSRSIYASAMPLQSFSKGPLGCPRIAILRVGPYVSGERRSIVGKATFRSQSARGAVDQR